MDRSPVLIAADIAFCGRGMFSYFASACNEIPLNDLWWPNEKSKIDGIRLHINPANVYVFLPT